MRDAGQRLWQLYRQLRRRPQAALSPSSAVVNTEVNSHNFLVDRSHDPAPVGLVDYEKAVNATPFLDLAHFLAPTTTRWKRGYRLTQAERTQFLGAYAEASGNPNRP